MVLGTGESLITTPQQLQGLIDHLRAIGRFAFDTEFVSEDTFEPILCLIQVATRAIGAGQPAGGPRRVGLLGRRLRPNRRGRDARGR